MEIATGGVPDKHKVIFPDPRNIHHAAKMMRQYRDER
jgi:hypothetical protein